MAQTLPASVYDNSDLQSSQNASGTLPASVYDDSDLNNSQSSAAAYNDARNQIFGAIKKVPSDVLAGLAEMGHGLINTPYNIANSAADITEMTPLLNKAGINSNDINKFTNKFIPHQQNYDFSSLAGISDRSLGDKIIQGATQYAPYALGGEAALPSNPSFLTRLGSSLGTGNAFGLTQSPTPVKSAIESGALNAGGQTIGDLLGGAYRWLSGAPDVVNSAGNMALKYLNRQSGKSAALSPAETADNLQRNFTDVNGNPVPVDIGTATNNPTIRNINSAIQQVPFSGATERQNSISDSLMTKKISDAQNDIAATQANPEAEYLTGKLQDLQSNPHADALQQQINELQQNPTADTLQSNINDVNTNLQTHANAINSAPQLLNQLADSVPDRANINQSLKDDTSSLFKSNKASVKQDYAPLNNPDIRLDQLGNSDSFNAYGSAASELLAQRQNLTNLFGSASDMGSKLNSELDKAQDFMDNKDKWGVTLPEGIKRIQNLGQLASAAASSGNRYESMLLGNLRDGLSDSVDGILRSSGRDDLADQLATANANYKSKVLPFYQNTEIRKTVTNPSYVPQGAKLAKTLHDTNNANVLNGLPDDTKNAALYQLVTGGKGTSSGTSNMTPAQIAASYAKLPVDSKRMIASYNPQADAAFENLPDLINRHADLTNNAAELNKQLQSSVRGNQVQTNTLQKQLQKSVADNAKQQNSLSNQIQSSNMKQQAQQQQAQAALDKLIQKKYGTSPQDTPHTDLASSVLKTLGLAVGGAHYLGKGVLGSTVALPLIARTINKAISNPELIQAYIKGEKLPVKNGPNIGRYINPFLQGILK